MFIPYIFPCMNYSIYFAQNIKQTIKITKIVEKSLYVILCKFFSLKKKI